MTELKTVAATLVVVGFVISFINLKYAPHRLALEGSPQRPAWLPWIGWVVTFMAAVTYIVVDTAPRLSSWWISLLD